MCRIQSKLRDELDEKKVSNMSQYWKDKVDATIDSADSLVLKCGDWSRGADQAKSFLNLTH